MLPMTIATKDAVELSFLARGEVFTYIKNFYIDVPFIQVAPFNKWTLLLLTIGISNIIDVIILISYYKYSALFINAL